METGLHASGHPKHQVYGWAVKDSPGTLIWVDKDSLKVDHSYQRSTNNNKVLSICKDWSWVACGVLTVAKRSSGYYVMDGQHRLASAMKRTDIKALPCIVFEVDSLKQEASGFLGANTNRKAVSVFDKHVAGVVAGDPKMVKLNDAFAAAGLEPINAYGGKSSGGGGTIRCISAAADAMDSMPMDKFERLLNICTKLSVAAESPIDSWVLRGLGYIYSNWEGDVPAKLEERLLSKGMESLKMASHKAAVFFGLTGEKVWGEGIMNEVNKGLKVKFQI